MDYFTETISKNLKTLREERKLSLDALSKLTCVSKSMLSQIEKGDTSPSVNTLWKIANGLKISFTLLLQEKKAEVAVSDFMQKGPVTASEGGYRVFPVYPFEADKNFEIYALEVDPHARLDSDGHTGEVQEYIIVNKGELTVTIDDNLYRVKKNQSITFKADKKHSYGNNGTVTAKAVMMLYYAK